MVHVPLGPKGRKNSLPIDWFHMNRHMRFLPILSPQKILHF